MFSCAFFCNFPPHSTFSPTFTLTCAALPHLLAQPCEPMAWPLKQLGFGHLVRGLPCYMNVEVDAEGSVRLEAPKKRLTADWGTCSTSYTPVGEGEAFPCNCWQFGLGMPGWIQHNGSWWLLTGCTSVPSILCRWSGAQSADQSHFATASHDGKLYSGYVRVSAAPSSECRAIPYTSSHVGHLT